MKKILAIGLGAFLFGGIILAQSGPFKASEYMNRADDILQRNTAGEITSTTSTDTLGSSTDRWDKIWADDTGAIIIDVDDTEAFLVRKDGDLGDVFSVDTVNTQVTIGAYTFPGTDGTADYVLATDGSGALSWVKSGAVEDGTAAGQMVFWDGTSEYKHSETSEIFWNDTDKRIGYGIATPGAMLEVQKADNSGAVPAVIIDNDDTTNNPATLQIENAGSGNSIVVDTTDFVLNASGEVGIGQVPVSGSKLSFPTDNDPVTPTLSFGDGDTGFYESSDNTLRIAIGGSNAWYTTSLGFHADSSTGPVLIPSGVSATVPTISPKRTDKDTGIGSSADDQLSLIAGATELFRIIEAATNSILIPENNIWFGQTDNAGTGVVNLFKANTSDEIEIGAALNVGTVEIEEDAGAVTFTDMSVTADPAAGTEESYSLMIDSNVIAKVYAEADSAGGLQNKRFLTGEDVKVGIGTTSPNTTLELEGTFSYTPSNDTSLAAATQITVANGIVRVLGTGGAVTLTGTPTIVDATDGTIVMIQGTDDTNTITLQDESSLADTGLQLPGGSDCVLGEGDTISLMYDSGMDKWIGASQCNDN